MAGGKVENEVAAAKVMRRPEEPHQAKEDQYRNINPGAEKSPEIGVRQFFFTLAPRMATTVYGRFEQQKILSESAKGGNEVCTWGLLDNQKKQKKASLVLPGRNPFSHFVFRCFLA